MAKMARLNKELSNSRMLVDVEQEFDTFEKDTNLTFNTMMNTEHLEEIQRSKSNVPDSQRQNRYAAAEHKRG